MHKKSIDFLCIQGFLAQKGSYIYINEIFHKTKIEVTRTCTIMMLSLLNLQLQKPFQQNSMRRKRWGKTLGINRRSLGSSTKAWSNRYNYHFDRNQPTQQEINQIFPLINVHGSKWSEIAKNIKGRKDLEIQNSFYANVKRICRRLIKAVYGTKASTQKTEKIKPVFIKKSFAMNTI